MSEFRVLKIYWTKKQDSHWHERMYRFKIALPVTTQLSEVEERVMALDCSLLDRERFSTDSSDYNRVHIIKLPDTYAGAPDAEKLLADVEQEIARLRKLKKEKEDKAKAEKDKKLAEINAALEQWLAEPDFMDSKVLEASYDKVCLPYQMRNYYEEGDVKLIKKIRDRIDVEHEKIIEAWLESPKLTANYPGDWYIGEFCVSNSFPKKYRAKVLSVINKLRAEKEARDKKQELKAKKEKELEEKERLALITEWSASHGSDRLEMQLEQGYDGWPLYLHERLAHDFKIMGLELNLDEDADEYDELRNPQEEWLSYANVVAEELVRLEVFKDMKEAFSHLSFRKYCERDGYEEIKYSYLVLENYTPGRWFADKRRSYTVTFLLETEKIS